MKEGDEEAKKNYEKFGNPDGRQAMEVSIGLPTFLLEKENHQVILVIYLLVLVIAIPTAVCIWYNDSKQYMDNMIRHDTMGWYHHMLNEHTHIKVLPEVLAGSQEYMLKIKLKETQLEAVGSLERELKLYEENMQKEKYRNGAPEKTKGYYLLHAHLLGLKIGKSLREDQRPRGLATERMLLSAEECEAARTGGEHGALNAGFWRLPLRQPSARFRAVAGAHRGWPAARPAGDGGAGCGRHRQAA